MGKKIKILVLKMLPQTSGMFRLKHILLFTVVGSTINLYINFHVFLYHADQKPQSTCPAKAFKGTRTPKEGYSGLWWIFLEGLQCFVSSLEFRFFS